MSYVLKKSRTLGPVEIIRRHTGGAVMAAGSGRRFLVRLAFRLQQGITNPSGQRGLTSRPIPPNVKGRTW